MVDKRKIKKWVKQDLIVKDLFREKDLSFDSVLDSVTTEVAVNRAIDLAIEKTLRDLLSEMKHLMGELYENELCTGIHYGGKYIQKMEEMLKEALEE